MAEIERLKQKRSSQKSVLTRTRKFFQKINVEELEPTTVVDLELRLKNLAVAFETFNKIQDDIDHLSGCEDESVREEFEDSYYRLSAEIGYLLSKNKNANIANGEGKSSDEPVTFNNSENSKRNPQYVGNSQITAMSNPFSQPQVHLPLSKLPQYNGEYNKWVEFRDTFQALVDRNPMITEVQKLHYLRSCLSPAVLETIQSIPITAANYDVAWSTLKNRYEKSQLIRQAHVKAILNLPRITKESAKDLRKFCNEFSNNLESLRNLGAPVDTCDFFIIPMLVEKLDAASQREWEKYAIGHDSFTLTDFLQVLTAKCDLLEKLDIIRQPGTKPFQKSNQLVHFSKTKKSIACFLCQGDHPIYFCPEFLRMQPKEKLHKIKSLNRCLNCLNDHPANKCKSKSTCRKCGKPHNTLLHDDSVANNQTPGDSPISKSDAQNLSNITHEQVFLSNTTQSVVLLSTAVVKIYDSKGNSHKCRALLDSGAMSNFISQGLRDKLGLTVSPVEYTIKGVGQCNMSVHSMTELEFASQYFPFKKTINCLVIDRITSKVPIKSFPKSALKIPKDIKLADPNYNISQPVDLLLGSSVFWQIMLTSRRRIPNSEVTLQLTKLGWILGGSHDVTDISRTNYQSVNTLAVDKSVQLQLNRFWDLDDGESDPIRAKSDEICEAHFLSTISRDNTGKFIVNIPFKDNYKALGQSRIQAEKRFYSLEKKLIRNPQLHSEYSKFMQEYIDLGHMKLCRESRDEEELNYYIPHHAVIRESSLTTKLRVVFNASMKTDSGLSLNDVQHIGPSLYRDLFSILINFRLYEFVIAADISKMYRMIWIHHTQTPFHRIFWRNNPQERLKCYELQTVTYGTASAPYLAVRCLHQIAAENETKFPKATKAIRNNFYVDDFLYGSNSEQELIAVQHDVTNLLRQSGFELRKWLCNKEHLYPQLHVNSKLDCSILTFSENEASKTLGVGWDGRNDYITYFRLSSDTEKITKRTILSEISQVFDPLNLLGPFTVLGKLLIQDLWRDKIDWDADVPESLRNRWLEFKSSLQFLSEIKIPRHITTGNPVDVELHGFGDASTRAYGAAIYLKTTTATNQSVMRLLCSKSRVAPIKQQTLPRLELCAAVLVAQLYDKLKQTIDIPISKQYFWSDSMITLAWIKGDPSKWKTFVGNRVGEIQRLTNTDDWYHIPSQENPADRLSRGATIQELIEDQLWWNGPSSTTIVQHITEPVSPQDVDNESRTTLNFSAQTMINDDILTKFSSLTKLNRVVAYCQRFSFNCKSAADDRRTGPLSVEELHIALQSLIRLSQQKQFHSDFKLLKQNKQVETTSKLLSLDPFCDQNDIIRVGGRIKNSLYSSFDKKHPIILAKNSRLTKLIFKEAHERLFHCGPNQLLAAVRETYWPMSGRSIAKLTTRNCRICFLARPRTIQYKLGNLPAPRVNESLPFSHVGLDYAGPFSLKDRMTRGAKLIKAYICIFVCLSTKAVHLEVVPNLTTPAFLNTLQRFVSRRGKPSAIYSDNAKTFVGAKNDLYKIYSFVTENQNYIVSQLANEKIVWKFIPPRAPHFGGIWEAGVKRVKFHLVRIMGNKNLTYDEFNTAICQIEAILNSRPLCPLSSSPSDPEPLTPSHFLLFRTPTSIPDHEDLTQVPESRLTKYHKIMQIKQHFWNRWHKEYLSELQQRRKWTRDTRDQDYLKPGIVVLVKERFSPCQRWPLAKIEEIHPGEDGIVRVVTVKLHGKLLQRPVSKICVLPMEV